MKDEKLLEDELLSDEELDNVAGGTFDEMVQLDNAIHANPDLASKLTSFTNGIATSEIQRLLRKELGIKVSLSYDEANQYNKLIFDSDFLKGKPLTHEEVLERIKNYKG